MKQPSREAVRRQQRRQKLEERERQSELEARRRGLMRRLRMGGLIGIALLLIALGVPWVLREVTLLIPTGSAPNVPLVAYQRADALGGQEVNLSQVLARGKPVVLNFYAGLCPPCRAEMPDFERSYQQYHDQVLILGLDIGPFVGLGSREDGKGLLRQLGISYPAATTFDRTVPRAYGVVSMPTTVFILPDGKIVRSSSGLLQRQQMSQFIEELLQASHAS